jgi:TatD DNase family protein
VIDSHTHIDGAEFDADRTEVLARARAAGVTAMVVVGTGRSLAQIRRAVDLAAAEPDVWAAVGVHPHDAKEMDESWWGPLEEMARAPRVVAIGETGLDFHYDHSPRVEQADRFRRHIRLARSLGKPVVCHIRDAHAESAAILEEEEAATVGGVIHCFTGGPDDAARYVGLGMYVSFSGIITFKSAEAIRAAAAIVPADRILIETDAPYLAPIPMRGKRNEPSYLGHTAEVVGRQKGMTGAELAAMAAANTTRLFGLNSSS